MMTSYVYYYYILVWSSAVIWAALAKRSLSESRTCSSLNQVGFSAKTSGSSEYLSANLSSLASHTATKRLSWARSVPTLDKSKFLFLTCSLLAFLYRVFGRSCSCCSASLLLLLLLGGKNSLSPFPSCAYRWSLCWESSCFFGDGGFSCFHLFSSTSSELLLP